MYPAEWKRVAGGLGFVVGNLRNICLILQGSYSTFSYRMHHASRNTCSRRRAPKSELLRIYMRDSLLVIPFHLVRSP